MYGPLVIEPRDPAPFHDREHVVMLTDWTDENPERVFAKLKKRSDYYNFQQRTVGDFFRDVRSMGLKNALADRKMWGEMRMNPTDLADVSGYPTRADERRNPAGNWTALQTRRTSAAALHQWLGDVVFRRANSRPEDDGRRCRRSCVHPVTVDEFRIATAETWRRVSSHLVKTRSRSAQSMDRTGFAAGTLAACEVALPEVPSSILVRCSRWPTWVMALDTTWAP